MQTRFRRNRVWIFWVLAGLLLAACGPAETEPAAGPGGAVEEAAVSQTTPEERPVTDAPTETAVPEPDPTETAVPHPSAATETPTVAGADASPTAENEQMVLDDGTVVFTTDDRSDRLRSATRRWGTNWNLRTVDTDEIFYALPRDGIPAINHPRFISQEEAAEWLADNEPVIALEIDSDARAYPLQILTWHEIVNDTVGDKPVVVTFCPLCNSAIVFNARVKGRVLDFGTSGLLRNSDLVMYDRQTETLWQQFTGEAIVGDLVGTQLAFVPSGLVSFADFRAAYPEGVVLSRVTGYERNYGQNPYPGYDAIGNNPALFTGDLDGRLPAVARVVTVSLDNGIDVAYPLEVLAERGVINDVQGDRELVVFHQPGAASALDTFTIAEAKDVGATGVFDRNLDGQTLTFRKEGDVFIDEETGSAWNVLGQAIDGPLVGEALTRIVSGDHFWFSWAAFKPDTIIFEG